MKANVRNRRAGFTLIEFIVGLVIAAIVASMVYSFFGSALTQSGLPILRLQKASNLSSVMENIVADYNRLNALNLRYKWVVSTAYRLNSIVTPKTIPATPDGGHYYKCTVAGTSGASEPSWPTGAGATVTDGGVTWKESGDLIVTVWQKSHPYTVVGTIVVPINNTGHYYRCTTGGTSGANEPLTSAWLPTTVPSTPWQVTDGTVTWTEAGTVLDTATTITTDNLQNYLTNYLTTYLGRYGTGYTVIENKFIQFNGSTEVNPGDSGTSSENNNLKVTIKSNDSAETLTVIFTIR